MDAYRAVTEFTAMTSIGIARGNVARIQNGRGVLLCVQHGAVWILSLDGVPSTPADLNGDGDVNGIDLAQLLAAWGPCPRIEPCPADLNGDGNVNGFDLALLLAAWG